MPFKSKKVPEKDKEFILELNNELASKKNVREVEELALRTLLAEKPIIAMREMTLSMAKCWKIMKVLERLQLEDAFLMLVLMTEYLTRELQLQDICDNYHLYMKPRSLKSRELLKSLSRHWLGRLPMTIYMSRCAVAVLLSSLEESYARVAPHDIGSALYPAVILARTLKTPIEQPQGVIQESFYSWYLDYKKDDPIKFFEPSQSKSAVCKKDYQDDFSFKKGSAKNVAFESTMDAHNKKSLSSSLEILDASNTSLPDLDAPVSISSNMHNKVLYETTGDIPDSHNGQMLIGKSFETQAKKFLSRDFSSENIPPIDALSCQNKVISATNHIKENRPKHPLMNRSESQLKGVLGSKFVSSNENVDNNFEPAVKKVCTVIDRTPRNAFSVLMSSRSRAKSTKIKK